MRAAYTLVETVVAIVVLSVAILALISVSAFIGNALNADSIREGANRIAINRVELLSAGCKIAVSGSEDLNQVHSSWTVQHPAPKTIGIDEVVTFTAPGGTRTEAYSARESCP